MEMTVETRQTSHTGTRRFSEGIEQLPDTPEKRLTGRFSRGIEQLPDTPEKRLTGRFSRGIEQSPDTHKRTAPRRFSHGIEQLPDTPEKRAVGRFSRGVEHYVERRRRAALAIVVRYLLVDDRDGRVLAELASAQQAMRLLCRFPRNPHGSPAVSVVRLNHQQGTLTDTTSMVSVRPLPPFMARRARN
jgi:hypothetical protein